MYHILSRAARGLVGSIKPINHTFKGINFVKKAPLFPDHLHPSPPTPFSSSSPPLYPLLPFFPGIPTP